MDYIEKIKECLKCTDEEAKEFYIMAVEQAEEQECSLEFSIQMIINRFC